MWRIEAGSAAAYAGDDVALPLGGSRAGVNFGRLVGDAQQEIAAIVANGFESSGAPGLSAAAQAWRLRSQGAANVAAPAGDAVRQEFLSAVAPWAGEAGARLGVAPELVMAHAALESGWGQRPIMGADGNSHNLFSIKAGRGWQGAVADVLTTEHVNGEAVKTVERFRAYPDYRSAFNDYVQLLQGNPRYAAVQGVGSDARAFAAALARGGYATDPAYADKLQQVASRLLAQR
ncbi:glucosaminidase domain-containing protein [Vogesella oryzae]|uniref:glucosaminidase domain-containing protein n=1 Tax=Vogesella oryzae TaxID=1735285 RepID=UPI00158333A2|nr:glucosaminidase domain-containing protein [Vogesella oryzae]